MRGPGAQLSATALSAAKWDKQGETSEQRRAPATSLGCSDTTRKVSWSFCSRKSLPPAGKFICVSQRNRFRPLIHPSPRRSREMKGAASVQHCLVHAQHQATWWAIAYQGNWGFLKLSEEAK